MNRSSEAKPVSLRDKVFNEVSSVFESTTSPRLSDEQVRGAVDLLFQLLEEPSSDRRQGNVGRQILNKLHRLFSGDDLDNVEDRFEPFCKLVLRLIDPDGFEELARSCKGKVEARHVLPTLELVSSEELKALKNWDWRERTLPPDTRLESPFLEHISRANKFRNMEGHNAPPMALRERCLALCSFCVSLVWTVFKFRKQIRSGLLRESFAPYLESVRRRFDSVHSRYVELATEVRSTAEYRFLGALSTSADVPSDAVIDASKLSEKSRVTVIEAEPGAGKTTTLKMLAWQQAEGLLARKPGYCLLPVYIVLKSFSAEDKLETTVEQCIRLIVGEKRPIPWDSLLLLVDGVNEVPRDTRTRIKAELSELLSGYPSLHAVVAGRPNWYRGEFEARLVVLRGLNDNQLLDLFQRTLGDAGKARLLAAYIRSSPFLSSWVRRPLHARMLASLARRPESSAPPHHAAVVRLCVRDLLDREANQASSGIQRTNWETKELLLARLAFETKRDDQRTFSRVAARSILAKAKDRDGIGAASLDVSQFIDEVRDNGLLVRGDDETIEFAQELYTDYFSATELEAQEQQQAGSGVDFVLTRFGDDRWSECIKLFAALSGTARTLVERGAESNPLLAWRMLPSEGDKVSNLRDLVADEAYCVLSAELNSPKEATQAGGCIMVLADLDHSDLLEKAIRAQSELLAPYRRNDPSADEIEQRWQLARPLISGLSLIVRIAAVEQFQEPGRFVRAARSTIEVFERVKATRILVGLLSLWPSDDFDVSKVFPRVILEALVNVGVDAVLDEEDTAMNRTLEQWLMRASEAGFSRAWPAYGRLLRLASCGYVAEAGIEFDGRKALKWLRRSHGGGDMEGTRELALLLIDEPGLSSTQGEGWRLLEGLASTDIQARYELGRRLMDGDGLSKDEALGIEHLLSAAEMRHEAARAKILLWWIERIDHGTCPLPVWATRFRDRLKALLQASPAGGP